MTNVAIIAGYIGAVAGILSGLVSLVEIKRKSKVIAEARATGTLALAMQRIAFLGLTYKALYYIAVVASLVSFGLSLWSWVVLGIDDWTSWTSMVSALLMMTYLSYLRPPTASSSEPVNSASLEIATATEEGTTQQQEVDKQLDKIKRKTLGVVSHDMSGLHKIDGMGGIHGNGTDGLTGPSTGLGGHNSSHAFGPAAGSSANPTTTTTVVTTVGTALTVAVVTSVFSGTVSAGSGIVKISQASQGWTYSLANAAAGSGTGFSTGVQCPSLLNVMCTDFNTCIADTSEYLLPSTQCCTTLTSLYTELACVQKLVQNSNSLSETTANSIEQSMLCLSDCYSQVSQSLETSIAQGTLASADFCTAQCLTSCPPRFRMPNKLRLFTV